MRTAYPTVGGPTSAVALLGSVPAESFQLFVVECEDHLERIETDALALESDPSARDNLDSLFGVSTASRAMPAFAGGCKRRLTEVEVLVKPLTGGLEKCKEFQGAAIMGGGRVVLVLNALECHGLSRAECT
jgi:chemotaxis protein histidine kinase CheA